jgi:hypothetical protein
MSSMTLSIDCGGLFIKSCVLDESGTMHAAPTRVETPYPLSTERFLETVEKISKSLPKAQRVTVGLPGMIRNGVVVATPHYINDAGPHTRMNPELKEKFRNFRDNILPHFKNYKIFSIDGVDIGWDLWNEHFIEYYTEVIIHIDNR